jgi:hypothetical protein
VNNRVGISLVRINVGLAVVGAVAFGLAAIPFTVLGKIVSGAPLPITMSNYLINIGAFALMGAIFSPLLTWSALRRAPLWRALSEPATGGVIGATIGTMLGSGPVFLLLAPIGVALAAWRLNRSVRPTDDEKIGGARIAAIASLSLVAALLSACASVSQGNIDSAPTALAGEYKFTGHVGGDGVLGTIRFDSAGEVELSVQASSRLPGACLSRQKLSNGKMYLFCGGVSLQLAVADQKVAPQAIASFQQIVSGRAEFDPFRCAPAANSANECAPNNTDTRTRVTRRFSGRVQVERVVPAHTPRN